MNLKKLLKKNRKAIMLHFLLSVVLAIILFVPACWFVSKFFRISDQATENFLDFAKEIDAMRDAQEEEIKSQILILDDGTAVVYFEPNKEEVLVSIDAAFPAVDFSVLLKIPSKCVKDKGCLCLFKEPEETSAGEIGNDIIIITESSASCFGIESPLRMDSCSIGTPHLINSQICTNGFIIERNMISERGESGVEIVSYYETPRRVNLQMKKENGWIVLNAVG